MGLLLLPPNDGVHCHHALNLDTLPPFIQCLKLPQLALTSNYMTEVLNANYATGDTLYFGTGSPPQSQNSPSAVPYLSPDLVSNVLVSFKQRHPISSWWIVLGARGIRRYSRSTETEMEVHEARDIGFGLQIYRQKRLHGG